ncbi:DUF4244 domain-containing protein [Microbacterium gorillae]|uniref:DUF4244 domain-containing protein n=1 Tax=Microbacterium gorillae TaxID=1231063 RepID=UPI003898F677
MSVTGRRRMHREIGIACPPISPGGSRVRSLREILRDPAGAATAEYAITTMAAVAFAGMLVIIMRSDEVRGMLTDLVQRALTVP